MISRIWFKGYAIYSVIFLIGILLIGNIYLIYINSKVIEHNRTLYENAEKIKVNTLDIVKNLHLVDLGLRSFVLTNNMEFIRTIDSALYYKDLIFTRIEKPLQAQNYPMENFNRMRDSLNAYYDSTKVMRDHLAAGRIDKFLVFLKPDPGTPVWFAYKRFSDHVNTFENNIAKVAKVRYQRALSNSYLLQIALFVITVPTLIFTARHTMRVLNMSEQLRKSHEENARLLEEQNIMLDQKVQERTMEIMKQNEEILAQNEEIAAHNEQLVSQQQEIELHRNALREQNERLEEAKRIIEQQHAQMQSRNVELSTKVDRSTQDLEKTNLELIEHNSKLEQFAYTVSHNLRAPMARFRGLAAILQYAKDDHELRQVISMMIKSSGELDQVISDLGFIVGLQKPGAQLLQPVDLASVVDKVMGMVEMEMKETSTIIRKDIQGVGTIQSLPQYIESIVYNLVSNAIKYRQPGRPPLVIVKARAENGLVRIDVSDNGLGIDLKKYRDSLFNLYKRFHFHIEGKGLGLYLVKTQVAALGGRIEVESKINQGTTFSIFLKG
ncbi:MAG: sensor histidine kinase [Bacteroidota bacterium]